MIVGSNKPISSRHWKLKEKALALRARGLSYKEILKQVRVSKSSISLWCRHVPLTTVQQKRLWEKHDISMRGIRAIQKMFWGRRCQAFQEGVTMARRVGQKERFVAGLMLYWAEGKKKHNASIANSDHRMIKFMVSWFGEFFGIPPAALVVHLHLHSGQNEYRMKEYWSQLTGIPLQNFQKSFVKPEGSGYRKNVLYHGTVQMRVKGEGSTYLLFRILGCLAGFLTWTTGELPKPEQWMDTLPHV